MKLVGRAQLLHAMGVLQPGEKTWRAGWSHDDGSYIYFDAWTNRYHEGRYPMCTDKEYVRPDSEGKVVHTDRRTDEAEEPEQARQGHLRWLYHLDLCIQGSRTPVLINPEPRVPGPRQSVPGSLGWHPRYCRGRLDQDELGHWWFVTNGPSPIAVDTSVDPNDQINHWAAEPEAIEKDETLIDTPIAIAGAMVERHINPGIIFEDTDLFVKTDVETYTAFQNRARCEWIGKTGKTFQEIDSADSVYRHFVKRENYNGGSINVDLRYDLNKGWIKFYKLTEQDDA